jgi:hypothetical protein
MVAVTTTSAGASASSTGGSEDSREARFLASQSARLLQSSSAGGAAGNSAGDPGEPLAMLVRTQFWEAFRRCRAVLSGELDAIASGSIVTGREGGEWGKASADGGGGGDGDGHPEEYATASARAVASARLDAVLASLRLLERRCLSASSAAPMDSPTSGVSGSNNGVDLPLPTAVPDHLPPGDVRLLTTELGSLQKRLEELRHDICPPELFVFRRYRAAMAARAGGDEMRDEAGGDGAAASASAGGIGGPAASTNHPSGDTKDGNGGAAQRQGQQEKEQEQQRDLEQHCGSSVRNQTNCTINVTAAGILICTSEDDAADSRTVPAAMPLDSAGAGSSLLIKDVKGCRVAM